MGASAAAELRQALLVRPAQSSQAAALTDDTGALESLEYRDGLGWKLPGLRCQVLYELRAGGVVLQHVVVVDRLFDEQARGHHRVDSGGRRVSSREERAAVDLTARRAPDFDDWIGWDHRQVKNHSRRDERLSEPTQDVHDVLGRHSSERPGEDDDVELRARDVNLAGGATAKRHPLGELGREPLSRRGHALGVRVEGPDASRLLGDTRGQPPLAAADLDDPLAAKVAQPSKRGEVCALRVESDRHSGDAGGRVVGALAATAGQRGDEPALARALTPSRAARDVQAPVDRRTP